MIMRFQFVIGCVPTKITSFGLSSRRVARRKLAAFFASRCRAVIGAKFFRSAPPLRTYICLGFPDKDNTPPLPFEHKAFLADALLESSGGVSPLTGNPKQIYVLRGAADLKNFAPITALHLDTTNAANFLLATRLELRPKDVVFVGTQPITNWNRMIEQIIPSLGLGNVNIPTIE